MNIPLVQRRLRQLRLTPSQLARALNIDRVTVWRWLRGDSEPRTIEGWMSLAEALDVPLSKIAGKP